MRRFVKVNGYGNAVLPTRATTGSAGYDIWVINSNPRVIKPGETVKFHTGIAVQMEEDEVFIIHVRSSVGIKRNLVLANSTGILDSDFYPNEMIIALTNVGNTAQVVNENERIAQGIFMKYLKIDDDTVDVERVGGIGSTNVEVKAA